MIQPQEIRIANYIEYNGEIIKLDGSFLCCYIQNELEFPLNPIPLTEEILLKFGFIKDEWCFTFPFNGGHTQYGLEWYGDKLGFSTSDGLTKETWIYYVHQLQNLFYSLCGEELQFNNE